MATCKYLGLLSTEADIQRRKYLTWQAYHKFKTTFNRRGITLDTKMKIFNHASIRNVMLCNSELGSTKKKIVKNIDAFQRRMIRFSLGVRWSMRMSIRELYRKSKQQPWSDTVMEEDFAGPVTSSVCQKVSQLGSCYPSVQDPQENPV